MLSGDGTATYLVECYWPGVDAQRLAEGERRAREVSAELSLRGRPVSFLGSVLVPADETVFCFFAGSEADVREASERAEIPFERVLEAGSVDIHACEEEGS